MSDDVKISVWGWDSTGSAAVRHVLEGAGLSVNESEPFEGTPRRSWRHWASCPMAVDGPLSL